MQRSIVALVPCDSYDEERVYGAVKAGLALLGGLERFVQKGENILLKPNLLSKSLPQKAITTHPAVFSAVARLLREEGYIHLSYGDSPGNPTSSPAAAAQVSGVSEAAQRWNIPLADFSSGSPVAFPAGRKSRSFFLCRGAQQADAIVNICKMKTHALERLTGAVKNLYGCVWGANKAAGHAVHPNSDAFAGMLADLNNCLRPRLHIMDGVVAMEGNGPTSGTPVSMNVLLFSDDPVALDSVFARLVDLDPALVPTCAYGAEYGVGVMAEEQIVVRTPQGDLSVREAAQKYGKSDFDVFRGALRKSLLGKLVPLLPFMQERPVVDASRCIGCGLCEKACPVASKAVSAGKGKKAKYDYRKCIRCYCCQEMCPEKAISVSRGLLVRRSG